MFICEVVRLKTWKMAQPMTLTDGDKCLIERYEFMRNYGTIHSNLKPHDSHPRLTGFIHPMELLLWHLEETLTTFNNDVNAAVFLQWVYYRHKDDFRCL